MANMNKNIFTRRFFAAACTAILIAGCNTAADQQSGGYTTTLEFAPGDEAKIVEACLSLKDSTSILLKAGNYSFDNLSMAQLKHIAFTGEGPDKTILDFSRQSQGGEGIRVTDVAGFTIKNIRVQNAKGDLVKVTKCRDVVFDNVHATWEKADSANGGYAIYPVLCTNVLVQHCYAQGSSDAGIYVGQSDSAIVRNCRAYLNVAGCEIENTTNAEVYDNEFYGNCAGFLIFDLPSLTKRGGGVKAYNNKIHDNNERNFAKSGSFGTSWGVGNAAPGSGVIVLATSGIELYNNTITGNNTSAIILASGLSTDDKALEKAGDTYFPFSKNISIHGNTLSMGDAFPAPAYEHHIGKILVGIEQALRSMDTSVKRLPLIVYDGFTTNLITGGTAANPDSLCISQTGSNLFINADFMHLADPANWKPSMDLAPYSCK